MRCNLGRGQSWNRRVWQGGLASLCLAVVGLAQEQPATRSQEGSLLALLNEGIYAYQDAEYDQAQLLLTKLEGMAGDRGDETTKTAVQYYLGLAYMARGLKGGEGEKADFERARTYFQKVLDAQLPQVRPAQLGLELGIAQLAAENERKELFSRAEKTLRDYIERNGKDDPYGYFFHGIAAWRVGFYVDAKPDDPTAADLSYKRARASLTKAVELQELKKAAALQQGIKKEEEWATFTVTVDYYTALLDLASGDYTVAAGELDRIGQNPEAKPEMRTRASSLAGEARQRAAETPSVAAYQFALVKSPPVGPIILQGRIETDAGFDSNVILLGKNTALPRLIPKQEDYFGGVSASLDLSRTFTRAQDGLKLGESLTVGIGGATLDRWQPSIREYDLNAYLGRTYVNWEFVKDLYVGLQYNFSEYQLGHEPYISAHQATPVLSKVWRKGRDELARTDLYYSYEYRGYTESVPNLGLDRSGNYQSAGLRQSFNLWRARDIWPNYYESRMETKEKPDAERWLSASVGYLHENDSTVGTEYDMHSDGVHAGVDVPLPWRLNFDVGCRFDWEDYGNRSLFDYRGQARSDFRQEYDFGLTYTVVARGECASMRSLEVKVRGSAELTVDDSNVVDRLREQVYDYNRGMYGIKLIVGF